MAPNFLHESWSYVGVAGFLVLLRLSLVVHQGGWRKLALDDALMVCALIFYGAETSAAHFIVGWKGLGNNAMTDEQRAALDPQSEEWKIRIQGSKMNIVGWSTYTTMFWLLKSCWTIYYSKLTEGIYRMDVRIKITWGLLASTFLACFGVIIFQCRPFNKNWQINPNPGNACQPAYSFLQVSFIMALNTVTDLWLMAIPLPIIWKARLDLKTKIGLLVLFSLSWIVVIFGIIRCVTLVTTKELEISQSGPWSVRESFLAFVVSNAPVIIPLFKRWFVSVTGIHSIRGKSSSDGSYPLGSQVKDSKAGSYGVGNSKGSKKPSKKFRHPLSLPTKWGSDEEITTNQQTMGTGGMGTEHKDVRDNISEITEGEQSTNLELEDMSAKPRHEARASKQLQTGRGHGNPGDIMVTREWEVAKNHGKVKNPELYAP